MGLTDLVQDSDALFISTGAAEPRGLIDELLADVVAFRSHLTVFQVLTGSTCRIVGISKYGHTVTTTVAPSGWRRDTSSVRLLDLSMRQCARAMEQGAIRVDGALVSVARFDDRLYPVPSTDLAMVALERARFRAAEVIAWPTEPSAPHIGAADVDYLIDSRRRPAAFPTAGPDERSDRIGAYVADLVPDGATIELGIGRALSSVAEALSHSRQALAVHTGLISDWAQLLVEAGVANRAQECAGHRPVVTAVAMGSNGFNDWVGHSNAIAFDDSRHAHDPRHLISLQPFVAINSAVSVDTAGSIGLPAGYGRTVSAGGLVDFAIAGAYGGMSIIALYARAKDGRRAIVEHLESVHLPDNLVTHVVTENGVAKLVDKSPAERASALLAIAGDSAPGLDRAPRPVERTNAIN